jgi:acrylyl-CoA reductase (NADPH)
MFRALLLEEREGKVAASVQSLDESRLPPGDVTVDIEYSTINYKDGMIVRGLGRMVRQYPHVPGIDFAGSIAQSSDNRYRPGDKVVLTGWRVGEARWGGYATKARVEGDWLVPLPADGPLTTKRAMAIGTAGLTAMLAIMALEEHGVTPDKGEVLVTGATGGVGSIAVALLSNLGYTVAASTGKAESHDYLRELGAATIIDRVELAAPCDKPLESERWAGGIDNVGGTTLARVLSQTKWHGSVAAVGLAGGASLTTSLLPFLLRGVNLLGIDSNACPPDRRRTAWQRLARELPMEKLDSMTRTAALEDLPGLANEILAGKVRGRVVIETGLSPGECP